MSQKLPYQIFQAEIKQVTRNSDGVTFTGFASTPDIDRAFDIIRPEAFEKSLKGYLKNPVLLRSHDADRPIGTIIASGKNKPIITKKGLLVTGKVTEQETADLIEEGVMRAMSIGFIPKETEFDFRKTGKYNSDGDELQMEVRVIKDLDLVEISIVTTPANPNALFTVEKSIKSLPSHIMKRHMCSVYPDLPAVGKIGERFFSQKALDELELKEEATPVEEEKVEETTEESEGAEEAVKEEETTEESKDEETPAETQEPEVAEEAASEVVTEEAPQTEGTENTEKSVESSEKTDAMIALMARLADEIKTLKTRMDSLPQPKGKNLMSLKPTGVDSKSEEYLSKLFHEARKGSVSL